MATVQNTQREQELANIIWDIKEIIRNLYDDAEVEDVILPFTLLRRLDCVLDNKREAIMQELKGTPEAMRKFKLKALMKKNNLSFFNTSGLSLERLLGAPEQIGQSFETYLNGFTDNVKDILANFVHSDTDSEIVDLTPIYSRLERGDKLFSVIQLFVQRADLHPDEVTNPKMGTVFEIVIRRSKEASNTKAGQFYTPREIVRLLVSLTLCGQESKLYEYGKHFTVYDPCCGTGGMLTVCKEYLEELSGRPDMKVYLYGQELNEKTYAICKSDLLMKGDNQNLDEQLFQGDTLGNDRLIRKMLLDRNLLDCIVALPKSLFYGTDISTYLWILDNNRPAERRDKVLFIDAAHSEYTHLLQKNLGKKRYEVSEEGSADILDIYRAYQSCSRARWSTLKSPSCLTTTTSVTPRLPLGAPCVSRLRLPTTV